MSNPKLKPCPSCGEPITVYVYDSGWRRAECDTCTYIAQPGESLLQAIRNHNARAALTPQPAPAEVTPT